MLTRHAEGRPARGARRQHGPAPPASRPQSQQGGIVTKEAPIHLSNIAIADPQGRQADPRRLQDRRRTARRCASPSARESRSMAEADYTSRAYEASLRRDHPQGAAASSSATRTRCRCPRSTRSCSTWASAKRSTTPRRCRSAAEDLAQIAGQKPVVTQRPQVDRRLQGARGHADRRQGHAAQGSACTSSSTGWSHRAAARARLPRAEPEELRRPRQLRHGHQGAHHFPGDQLRQDRPGLGHGHHRLHDGEDRRRGAGAAQGIQFPFRQ